MPILGIIASQITGHLNNNSYESIATVNVSSGGASTVSFSSIPGTYKHLQIRGFSQTNRPIYTTDNALMLLGNGSIDTGANYSKHSLYSDYQNGSAVYADGSANSSDINAIFTTTGVASAFGACVIDILDYSNTNKYKTIRSLSGADANGTVALYNPSVGIASGSWRSTSAVTNIRFSPVTGTGFNQYTSFALYGVKG